MQYDLLPLVRDIILNDEAIEMAMSEMWNKRSSNRNAPSSQGSTQYDGICVS